MIVNENKNRQLTEICCNTEHYLANMLAITKLLGVPLQDAKHICKKCTPGKRIALDKPIPIISKLNTDKLFDALDEYEITISITIK